MTGGGFTLWSLLVIAWPLPCLAVLVGVAGLLPVVLAGVVRLVSVLMASMVSGCAEVVTPSPYLFEIVANCPGVRRGCASLVAAFLPGGFALVVLERSPPVCCCPGLPVPGGS